ncbi:MAG: SOS response-associated peptidase [Myxococcota bacterium]
MCGRFGMALSGEDLADLLEIPLEDVADATPRWNVAPTQRVPVARVLPGEGRRGAWLRWGLVPFWAKDTRIGNKLINARGETAASKPAFRAAFERRRCLVPADGFYEWRKVPGQRTKEPWHVGLVDGEPFTMAGLWESWDDPETGEVLETFTILTTDPNPMVARLHDRMPAIVDAQDRARWLDPYTPRDALSAMLGPFPADRMEGWPVTTRVNTPAHDDPGCRERLPTLL